MVEKRLRKTSVARMDFLEVVAFCKAMRRGAPCRCNVGGFLVVFAGVCKRMCLVQNAGFFWNLFFFFRRKGLACGTVFDCRLFSDVATRKVTAITFFVKKSPRQDIFG